MSLTDRLASNGARDPPGMIAPCDADPPDISGSGFMQKCIIIQRDEKGYGFTVSGDNPVFVTSVKQDGVAAKAGLQTGDRIIKVNGTLVTQRNHLDVVKLIKSGPCVVLTLMGKPTPVSPGGLGPNSPSNRDSSIGRVTAPQPVDPDKDRELWQQKVHMTRTMYETAKEDLENLQKLFARRPTEKLHAQLLEKERTAKALDNQLKHLMGGEDILMHSNIAAIPNSFLDSENMSGEHCSVQSWASSLPRNTSDQGSMSDSPHTSPSVSPPPDYNSGHNGQDLEDPVIDSRKIIHNDDEEINSEDDQVNEPGPFANIKLLENKPAHMAVFLNYLISNNDPSPVLFHIISDLYCRTAASTKELRKWAYEITSTFIFKVAPLSISVEDNIVNQIESILTNSGSRTDNENILRAIFHPARQSVQMEIAELLTDFRSKKDLGMGNLFGTDKVYDGMDRSLEVKVAEELLMKHIKYFGSEDNSRSVVTDKDQATHWALATFLRFLGGAKSANSTALDRVQTFMTKDKKSIKFPGSRSSRAKAVKGHQLTLQHFYMTTLCNFCGKLVWGVGCQGYQCQSCEMILHKTCAEEITEQCGGKLKKKSPRLPLASAMQSHRLSSIASGLPALASEQIPHVGSTGQVKEPRSASLTDPTQPYPRRENLELGATLSMIAGLPTGHSVKSIITRYQTMTSPTGPAPGSLIVPDQEGTSGAVLTSDSTTRDRRGSSDLSRSGSLNTKEEKAEKPARRAHSDVHVDADTFKTMNQSGSSSASSLSSRSVESPASSTDNMSDLWRAQNEDPDLDVEPELPPLKQMLPEEVLRKLKPKEKKRQEVINELFYTERAHLRNLKVLDLLFHRPMLQEKGVMADLARALFPNMEEMISLHVMFVKDIKDRSQATPVVKDVSDLLLKRFDGEAGDRFRKGCAEYCRNQAFALDALKKHTRKEPKLQQFLHDAESNSLCRRLQLKDLVPSQMQRLTKYPLLIDNLLKYTPTQSEEYRRLERAHDRSKHILAYVNHTVKDCENYHKLKDIQKRMDRRSVEGVNDPALTDLKNLDLTHHTLIFDGPLTWKLRTHRTLDIHVLLFEDIMVLLHKQDDKYVLKCQNTNAQPARDDKYTHHPILKLQNLLARTLATDKRSFFVVNISECRAQMYEFTAASPELRVKWCKLINDKADECKKTLKLPQLYSDFSQASQMEHVAMERNRPSRISRKARSSAVLSQAGQTNKPAGQDIYEVSDHLRQHLEITEDSHSLVELIPPEEVSVSHAVMIQSAAISSSLELLRCNGEKIEAALCEREHIMADLVKLSWDRYIGGQPVCPPARYGDQEQGDANEGTDYNTTPAFLLAQAMDLNGRYIKLICDASHVFAHQQVDEVNSLVSRTLSELNSGDTPEPNSSGLFLQRSSPSVPLPMDQIKSNASQMNVILTNLAGALSSQSEERDLLKEELHKTRTILDSLTQQHKLLAESSKVCSGRASPCVPTSTAVSNEMDIPILSQALDTPELEHVPSQSQALDTPELEHVPSQSQALNTPELEHVPSQSQALDTPEMEHVPSQSQALDTPGLEHIPTASPAFSPLEEQESDVLNHKYELENETPVSSTSVIPGISASDIEGEVYHGIQEATLAQFEECVEPLSSSLSSIDLLPVVATETRTSPTILRGASPEIELGDDDIDLSVADLPLPELFSTDTNEMMSAQLGDAMDIDDSETESDDSDTLTIKTNYQDLSSLTPTMEDIDGEQREVEEQV